MKTRMRWLIILAGCILPVLFLFANVTDSTVKEKAIKDAIRTNDSAKLIEVLIEKMKEQVETDEDSFPTLIQDIEKFTIQCNDSAAVAVLHSMTGEMYNRYYQRNRWKINQRTPITDYIPEDIREWTNNLFTQKIAEELNASLKNSQLLQQTAISQFNPILEIGKDSKMLRPTLFDFLSYRAINIQPIPEFYQNLIAFRKTQSNPKATLLAQLDYLQYQYNQSLSEKGSKEYKASLDSLLKVYADKPFSIEIQIARLNAVMNIYSFGMNNYDSINAIRYTICKEGIKNYPNYERTNILRNTLNELENPSLSVETPNTVYPETDLKIKLNYKNLSQVTIQIYHSLKKPEETIYQYGWNKEQKSSLGKLVKTVIFTIDNPDAYSTLDTTLKVSMRDPGLYECVITADNQKIRTTNLVSVTRLANVFRSTDKGIREVFVTDYLSGKPIKDASIFYYKKQKDSLQQIGVVKTNREGLAQLPNDNKLYAYQVTRQGDGFPFLSRLYQEGRYSNESNTDKYRISLFTDRGIYRPGQTVYFKGIAYISESDSPHVVANKPVSIQFRDANNKEVSSKKFTTNQFGSFNGEFTIPKNVLTGTFNLSTEFGSIYISVEEYKRPTFFLDIQPIKEDIAFGDSIFIQGKAQTFSGVSLQNGKVTFRIIRRPFWLRAFNYPYFNESQVAEGTVPIHPDGTFSIPFCPEKPKKSDTWLKYQTFEVSALLTDSKGETQETQYTFSVGETGMVLSTNLPEKVNKDSVNAIITAQNLNGENLQTEGRYSLKLIESAEKKENKIITSGNFTAGKTIDSQVFSQIPSGRYELIMEAKDSKGREIKNQQEFILYSPKDKRPPIFMSTWFLPEKTQCLPGETAEFVFGTSEKKTYILYEIYNNSVCIERKIEELNNENRTFRVPWKEEYGEGISVSLTFIKNGKLYTLQIPIYKQLPNRNLSIYPETFRDRLLPGSNETWKFRVLQADSLPAMAEVLASMYDASLDKIRPFKWNLYTNWYPNLYIPMFQNSNGFNNSHSYDTKRINFLKIEDYQYDQINWQGIMISQYPSLRARAAGMVQAYSKAAPDAVLAENIVTSEEIVAEEDIADSDMPSAPGKVQIRTNFNECAFFYPNLLTDKEGNVIVSFSIPESNTTWKLQMLAQTKDLKSGELTREVITQKPLMVLPNLPRFFRQGDQVSVSTQVINASDKNISGRVRLELFDPATDQPVLCLTKSQSPFTLQPDSITTASWTFTVPNTTDLLGCRIIADSNTGSDGEQRLVPVLSNQILITESTPFYLIKEGESKIKVPIVTNSTTYRPFRMTLEITSNPVWYAVQALPTVTTPTNNNVISWFAAYYSNTLASYIVQSSPRLKQVISAWKAQGGNATTLLSNLEKNEELKQVLLEETPWVLEADNETEQKQRLELLFDTNRADQMRAEAFRRLIEQQNEDGGWSWMKGMSANREITLFILNGMTQLTQLSAVQYNQEEKEMQMKALKYLDKSIQQDYEAYQRQTKKMTYPLTSSQLNYLYVRSAYRDIPELGEAREAIRYYTNRAEKEWKEQTIQGKGEIAILMFRNGKKEVATTILAWLRKTATHSAEKGMYWANNKRGYNFFTSPIDTHCLLMSAFNEISPNIDENNEMKQWLLCQKRTQQWESVPSTVNAIYSLLLTGSDWLSNNNQCDIQWGKLNFNTNKGEIATGYIKETVNASEITPEMQTVTITKTGKAPAWGAVYNQYFESIKEVKGQKGVLNVEKKLFIETNNGTERQIKPITPDSPLKIGDKVIVRLVVRTDREMDYVQLKDQRAGCFEPAEQLSGIKCQDGVCYYRTPGDVSENFFFDRLPQGTYVLEYKVYVSQSGKYAGGISTIQCLYAPEYVSHTEGQEILVQE